MQMPSRSTLEGHAACLSASMLQEDVSVTAAAGASQFMTVARDPAGMPPVPGAAAHLVSKVEQVIPPVPSQVCFITMVAAELTVTPIAIIIKILQNIFR